MIIDKTLNSDNNSATSTGGEALRKFIMLYSLLTLLTAFLMGLENTQFLVLMFKSFNTFENLPEMDHITGYILTLYVILFSLTAVLIELEWSSFVTKSKILTSWTTRGLLYIFLGILSLDLMETSQSKLENMCNNLDMIYQEIEKLANGFDVIKIFQFIPKIKELFNTIVSNQNQILVDWEKRLRMILSWMIVGFGVGYFLMGLFCLQYVFETSLRMLNQQSAKIHVVDTEAVTKVEKS